MACDCDKPTPSRPRVAASAIRAAGGLLKHAGKIAHGSARFSHIIDGARSYFEAIARGETATAEQEAEQRAACAACPSRVDVTVRGKTASYCGPAFEDRLADDPPTCGCPVDGIALTSPAFKSCPQGKGPQP